MDNSTLHENVHSIELKCNELISEINQHLSIYQDVNDLNYSKPLIQNPIKKCADGSKKSKNKFNGNSFITCHNKMITLPLKGNNRKSLNHLSDTTEILIPQQICNKITKINQPLMDVKSEDLNLNPNFSNLGIHHLNHIHIGSQLTKQKVFSVHIPDEKPIESKTNVRTYDCIHKDSEENSSESTEKNENKINHLKCNELRKFLFGDHGFKKVHFH